MVGVDPQRVSFAEGGENLDQVVMRQHEAELKNTWLSQTGSQSSASQFGQLNAHLKVRERFYRHAYKIDDVRFDQSDPSSVKMSKKLAGPSKSHCAENRIGCWKRYEARSVRIRYETTRKPGRAIQLRSHMDAALPGDPSAKIFSHRRSSNSAESIQPVVRREVNVGPGRWLWAAKCNGAPGRPIERENGASGRACLNPRSDNA